jgi:exodeoxyribonuclease VII large subunit
MYFTLKDDLSQIRAVMFRGQAQFLKFRPENGTEVITWGRVSVYEARGDYQLILDTMEPKGLGALTLAYEQLREKLTAEGLFHESRKRPLPRFPGLIGLVTSPRGAALRDMIRIIQRRAPHISILVSPCLVQGEKAPLEIERALQRICSVPQVDVVILGRGGGSMEDLWAFNDERVVRAAAECTAPIVSAIGHETDFTLTDFAADLRASTPSAAAEMVAPDHRDIRESLFFLVSKLRAGIVKQIELSYSRTKDALTRMPHPGKGLEDRRIRADDLSMRLAASMKRTVRELNRECATLKSRLNAEHVLRKINRDREQVSDLVFRLGTQGKIITQSESGLVQELHSRLQAMNPYQVLARGYSIATRSDANTIITDSRQVAPSDTLDLKVARGRIQCSVIETINREKDWKEEE